jgi:hypothetical protein
MSRSPQTPHEQSGQRPPLPMAIDSHQPQAMQISQGHPRHPHAEPFPPTYDQYTSHEIASQAILSVPMANHQFHMDFDQLINGFGTTANDQLPLWLLDQIGGFQHHLDAYLLPAQNAQIW